MSALAELAADAETAAGLGHNQPPEPTPFDACKAHMEDLLTEARNWADGVKVETQAQADDVSRLMEDLRLAMDAADDVRVTEKKPFDEIIAEIQDRYNVYIAPLKNKTPGKVPVAIDALKAVLKPYLDAQEAERQAEAKRVREEAEKAAQAAAEAARSAAPDDLAAREQAEELISAAAQLDAQAKRTENARPQAHGGARALWLKKTFTPILANPSEALKHYAAQRAPELKAFLLELAVADVREGKRAIPGFVIQEGTKL